MSYNVAVVGATGAVGQEMIKGLIRRNFPVKNIKYLASSRSAGKTLKFKDRDVIVEELTENSFNDVDIALFSAGGDRSKQFAPAAVKAGAVVIDNSSAFRMDKDIPLVVPEVNPLAAKNHKGLIANPNCSTIQMVVALKPLYNLSKIKQIVVSTYQAVAGAGLTAIDELLRQSQEVLNKEEIKPPVKFSHQIAFNCIPQIDSFTDDLFTKEELKMVWETRKIMEDDDIIVTPTAVRVPVVRGHSESVYVVFENKITRDEAIKALSEFSNVVVVDEPFKNEFPLASDCVGKDETFVGRIREDLFVKTALNMWIVSDNLLKGAATNAIQIAELLVENKWL